MEITQPMRAKAQIWIQNDLTPKPMLISLDSTEFNSMVSSHLPLRRMEGLISSNCYQEWPTELGREEWKLPWVSGSLFLLCLPKGIIRSPFCGVLNQDPKRAHWGVIAGTKVRKHVFSFLFFFQIPNWKIIEFPNLMSLPFPHLMEFCVFVCVLVTRFAEKPSEQDSPDTDCCEFLHPGHGVWQPDVLSTHREGDSACARALHSRW